MASIVGWRMEGDKIILSLVDDDGKDYSMELPLDVYKELLLSGPPTEEQHARKLIDEIRRIQKKQLLLVEEMDKLAQSYSDESETIRKEAMAATEKIEVQRLGVAIRAVAGKRADLAQRRHLCKLLDNTLGDLQVKLLKKLRG